MSSLLVEALE